MREIARLSCTSTGSIERAIKKLGFANFSDYRYYQKYQTHQAQAVKKFFGLTKSTQISQEIQQLSARTIGLAAVFEFHGKHWQTRQQAFLRQCRQQLEKCQLTLQASQKQLVITALDRTRIHDRTDFPREHYSILAVHESGWPWSSMAAC